MVLLYTLPGAVQPIFPLWLKELNFSSVAIGWICGTQALAALVAPLIAGQVADRWLSLDRLLSGCAVYCAVILWIMADIRTPPAMFVCYFAFWLGVWPLLILSATLSLGHLTDPERQYGKVRLWGTVGWVSVGWVVGHWLSNPAWLLTIQGWLRADSGAVDLADALRIAAVLALMLSLYALTLPATPPQSTNGARLAPLAAAALLRRRGFGTYCLCNLLVSMSLPFWQQLTPLLLNSLGVEREWVLPAQTLSQLLEVPSFALLPVLLPNIGFRWTMLIGLTAWTFGLAILTIGSPLGLVLAAQCTWGLVIGYFFVVGQVFTNRQASGDIRASAQGVNTLANGIGMVIGNPLTGWVHQQAAGSFVVPFGVACSLSLLAVLVFFLRFRDGEQSAG